jgi:hypothetical protein
VRLLRGSNREDRALHPNVLGVITGPARRIPAPLQFTAVASPVCSARLSGSPKTRRRAGSADKAGKGRTKAATR